MSDDPKERFSDRADDYARYRPSYPDEIIAAILEGYTSPLVADLGAGTGISAELLARAGARVFAVEPNASMRRMIAPLPAITPVAGTAEATTLPDDSADVVTAFQAYHWFEPDRVLVEARRILRPRGRFAAVWNHRDRSDPFTGAYEHIVDRFDESGGDIDRTRRLSTVMGDLRRHGWRNVRTVTASFRQGLDWETLIGRARSASYLPKNGAPYESMERELRRLFETWGGEIAFTYVTQAFVAEAPLE
ncbi:MAG TPA: class I SAM-dependent methyltransferase [Candidatus Aquilonibacter sp.]|nr:class I SAM-dependent methyltransferase [Candidatus Aquilonibacter sp.]